MLTQNKHDTQSDIVFCHVPFTQQQFRYGALLNSLPCSFILDNARLLRVCEEAKANPC